MAGGHMKYRHLGVKSSHRQALLRNLVTSLIEHESITTTYAKAKEAQRFAEKLITLAKRNTDTAKVKAGAILFRPELIPRLFNDLRLRYSQRPGGYTRVLRIEPHKEDQAESAILELVDGERDTRFAMLAKTIASERETGRPMHERTLLNIQKVTRFRAGGEGALEKMVGQISRRKAAVREEGLEAEVEARRKMGERKERTYAPYDIENRGRHIPKTGTGKRHGISQLQNI